MSNACVLEAIVVASFLILQPAQAASTHAIAKGKLTFTWDGEYGRLTRVQGTAPASLTFAWPSPVVATASQVLADDGFGSGEAVTLTHANGWTTRLALFDRSEFLHCQTTVANPDETPLVLRKATLATWTVDLGPSADQLRALGTGGLTSLPDAQGSYSFSAVADPQSRRGVVSGWLTHHQGIGVYFPSLRPDDQGQPIAAVEAVEEFGRFQVEPQGNRPTDVMLLGLFDDCRLGLERYAEEVAVREHIRLKPQPSVYCTWYHAGASDQGRLAENARFVAEQLRPFGLSVIQIDDLWQAEMPRALADTLDAAQIVPQGPVKVFVEANANYPDGMEAMARTIGELGLTPGIWFMPFAGNHTHPYFDPAIFARRADGSAFDDDVARWSGTCIDLTHPQGEAFVRQTVRRIYGWGYRYFKIDGIHTGIPTPNIYVNTSYKDDRFGEAVLHDPSMTHAEAYRRGLQALREEAPEAFVLGCNVSQNMRSMGPAFGLLDAMRIGPDNGAAGRGDWGEVTTGAWHGTNLYFLNNRVWHNDPDPVYVRPSNPVSHARWMCTWLAISGAMHTSSEQYGELPEERIDLLRRCLPSHGLAARPVDYLATNRPQIWTVGDDRLRVVGLFNWDERQPVRIEVGLDQLGCDPDQTYVGFDYWVNRFLGPLRGRLEATLEGAGCRSLALRPLADRPVVVSTSRHIAQGLVDLREEAWDADSLVLSGSSDVAPGDAYELRLAWPSDLRLRLVSAELGGVPCATATEPGDPAGTARVRATPAAGGRTAWRVEFAR